ncbi:HAMP domain-containing sensor histidine kinase [Clostridium sp.]|uniref:sensor histidine kinase n=1 Tax=Clostridium sp. TaxID=1506 RepID=UPI0025C6982D|nr:HAMP domain-containing sensor histidine kinase [Clostridium sp.]
MFKRSLKKEFLLLSLISLLIVVAGIIMSIRIEYENSTVGLINLFNKSYIDIQRYVNKLDDNSKEYFNEVCDLNKVNAAIVDVHGNIYMKSKNVDETIIDVNKIEKIFHNKYSDENIYQRYDIRLDNKDYNLLIWREKVGSEVFIKIILVISISFLLAIFIIYIYAFRKAKYIGELTKGIYEFSSGNLDYLISEKGKDELRFLAKGMNLMAKNLKNSIDSERNQERFKSELITNVSHDLRTPLTSIIGYLQLIDNEKTSEENKKRYTKSAIEKSYKLRDLIGDLFEYSKLQSNSVSLNKSNVNIIEIIEQSIGELYIEATEKNIVFIKRYEYSNINLSIDSSKIGRVFQNVLSNSVKYSRKNSNILINIFKKNNNIIISFENEIEQESLKDIDKIFNRFYRCNESRNSEIPGSGLGLAIAKNIIDLHNGEIYVECNNNIFKLYIKLSVT